jgi:hypothetical protein
MKILSLLTKDAFKTTYFNKQLSGFYIEKCFLVTFINNPIIIYNMKL